MVEFTTGFLNFYSAFWYGIGVSALIMFIIGYIVYKRKKHLSIPAIGIGVAITPLILFQTTLFFCGCTFLSNIDNCNDSTTYTKKKEVQSNWLIDIEQFLPFSQYNIEKVEGKNTNISISNQQLKTIVKTFTYRRVFWTILLIIITTFLMSKTTKSMKEKISKNKVSNIN